MSNNRWKIRALLLAVMDAVLIGGAYYFALLARFDFRYSHIDAAFVEGFNTLIIPYILVAISVFYVLRLYHSIWEFASVSELWHMIEAWGIIQLCFALIYFITELRMPISFWIIGCMTGFALTTGLRFSYRFARLLVIMRRDNGASERVMIIGAGDAGKVIIREYRTSKRLHTRVCCIIDDERNKHGLYIDGIPIVGDRTTILDNAVKYGITKIVVAMPSAPAHVRRDIISICSEAHCQVQSVPGVYQLVDGEISVSKLRDVQPEDLLGREPVKTDLDELYRFIAGKVVLVTGGGGSIGSELCRQVAMCNPKQLIIFDIFEGNAYWIQQELKKRYGDKLNLVTLIGSVRDYNKLLSMMEIYHPNIVIHAAAHKHVPLMEDSPHEAIKNNVIGTYNTAKAALENGVSRFVLISTDKAVNPTNIMGASKRLCEMLIQMMDRRAKEDKKATSFVAVRFGNVLGSSGSVIPLFKKEIAAGGPVTVTDKRIIRYFMTIPEAVSLVLQAGCYAHGGEIFVLDMGEPVKIDDMARKLIRLAGYEPDIDIKIEYTGLRPGEKLYEERLMDEEGMATTPNELISIAHPILMDDAEFCKQLDYLMAIADDESVAIRPVVSQMVPTYTP